MKPTCGVYAVAGLAAAMWCCALAEGAVAAFYPTTNGTNITAAANLYGSNVVVKKCRPRTGTPLPTTNTSGNRSSASHHHRPRLPPPQASRHAPARHRHVHGYLQEDPVRVLSFFSLFLCVNVC